MPRCLSNSMESIVAPTPSFPFTYTTQVRESIREPHLNGKKSLIKTMKRTHLVDLCYPAGVVEHALGQGGFPRVDVSGDPDVADPLAWKDTGGAAPAAVDEHLRI